MANKRVRPPAVFDPNPLGGRGSPMEDPESSQMDLYGSLMAQGRGMGLPVAVAARQPAAWQNTRTDQTKMGQKQMAPQAFTPDQLMPFLDRLREQPEYQDYAQGLQMQSDSIPDSTGGSELDFSPVMAFADYAAGPGGKALAGYRRPEGLPDKLKRVNDIMTKTQDDRRDMVKSIATIMALGKSQGFNSTQVDKVTTNKQVNQSDDFKTSKGAQFDPYKFKKSFDGTLEVKSMRDQLNGAIGVLRELQNPNWFTDRNATGKIVELRGLKPVSNEDYRHGGGSEDLYNRAQKLLGQLSNGEALTEADRDTIGRHARALVKSYEKSLNDAAENFTDGMLSLDPRANGVDREKAVQTLKAYTKGFLPPDYDKLGKSQFEQILEKMDQPKPAPSGAPSLRDTIKTLQKNK